MRTVLLTSFILASSVTLYGSSVESSSSAAAVDPLNAPADASESRIIRGIHLTASAAGSKKYRQKLDWVFQETVINSVVIDIKEENGWIYVPGVKAADRAKAYRPVIPDLEAWLKTLKEKGIYTVARIVVFKDNIGPRHVRDSAVRNPQGELWFDRHKTTWFDPYSPEAHTYNLLVALECAKLGFDEIQFDYIRFPTDGNLSTTRYAKPFNRQTSSQALVDFLRKARQLIHPLGAKLSIDVFGLTTSDNSGMGIGQLMGPMAEQVDFVCPMVYPSHYNPGEYGIPIPNDNPYRTIYFAMRDAKKTLGPDAIKKLRPYLQDFSLKGRGIRYGVPEVRAQIQACADHGIFSWTLWNARCSYTWDALKTPAKPSITVSISTASETVSETQVSTQPLRSSIDDKPAK